ncbi:DUF1254 domain-containing protein [Gordonia sp. PKS22-38]|uniref:DUF1254 domain-containing protein n=1 Tax=Gordonia prachuapensis TaxID=3115651 RepID=A0ABU7MZL0_9ACTN|nr:DUF1254 domain-containing protein [Gordonia sp. PKS22-38]
MNRRLDRVPRAARRVHSGILVILLAMLGITLTSTPAAAAPRLGVSSLEEAAVAAYTYTYPLVSMEVTRRQNTNVPVPISAIGIAPTNQLGSKDNLPDASFKGVVRTNVDTLYTSMLYDVAAEPIVISVPDMGDRYHVFSIMDMWTDTTAAPGSRTVGDGKAYRFAIVGPNWKGTLPAGIREYRMATDTGWMIGRIQVNGPNDIPAVQGLQRQLSAVPLSSLGRPYIPLPNTDLHPDWPRNVKVGDYIAALSPQEYWDLYYEARSHTQTRPADRELLADLARYGWSPNRRLDLNSLSAADRAVWTKAWPETRGRLDFANTTPQVNGWRTPVESIGAYGTDYLARAVTAARLLGANLPEDAVYAMSETTGDGRPLRADKDYVLHFDKDQVPDVRAFWSLTLYDEQGYLAANPINRYAVRGERLRTNPDGSIDIYIQRENPGPAKESNWLPMPADGQASLVLRLYWPSEQIVDGNWNPPAVTRVG